MRVWWSWIGLFVLAGLGSAVYGAVPLGGFNEMSTQTTGNIRGIEAFLRGPGMAIVGGLLVIGVIVTIMKSQYMAAVAFFLGILLLSLTFIFTGASPQAMYGPNGQLMTVDKFTSPFTYEVELYGDNDPDMATSEFALNNNIVKGNFLAACVTVNRVFSWLFGSAIMAIVIIAVVLFGLMNLIRSPRPLLVFGIYFFVFILGLLMVFPIVEVSIGPSNNITYNQLQDLHRPSGVPTDGSSDVDTPRIPILPAIFLAVSNELANGAGRAMRGETVGPHETINRIGASAKMNSRAFDLYREFSENCFMSVQNLNAMTDPHLTPDEQAVRDDIEDRKIDWQDEFRVNQHALSRVSDQLFLDVDYDGYIFNERADLTENGGPAMWDTFNRLGGSLYRKDLPQAHLDEHAGLGTLQRWQRLPVMTTGQALVHMVSEDVADVYTFRALRRLFTADTNITANVPGFFLRRPIFNDTDGHTIANADRVAVSFSFSRGFSLNHRTLWRGYCACNAELTYDYGERAFVGFGEASRLPADLSRRNQAMGITISAANLGDVVRLGILEPYLGAHLEPVQDTCFAAAKEGRTSPDLWGCLVAGFYNAPMSAENQEKYRSYIDLQRYFDATYREGLINNSARNGTVSGLSRAGVTGAYTNGFTDTAAQLRPGSGWDQTRTLVDVFMMAPGVGSQIGLHRRSAQVDQVSEGNPGIAARVEAAAWGLFDFVGGTMAGFFAWVASIMSDIALKMWPFALGWAYTFLIYSWIPYGVMSLIPGKHFMFLEWFKAAIWIAFWPVLMHFGFNELNSLAGTEMSAFYTNQGGDDMAVNIRRIWGATLIIGAPALTAMFLVLGMGGLMAGIGSTVGSAFTLMRSLFILPIAAAGTLAGGVAGGVLGRSISQSIEKAKQLLSDNGGGGKTPKIDSAADRPKIVNRTQNNPDAGPGAGQRTERT